MLKRIQARSFSASKILAPRSQPFQGRVHHSKKSFHQGQDRGCLLCPPSTLETKSVRQSKGRCSLLGLTKEPVMCLTSPRKLAATASEQAIQADTSPLFWRHLLRKRVAVFEFKVNGVSFHSRQEPVQGLEPGMLVSNQSSLCSDTAVSMPGPCCKVFLF